MPARAVAKPPDFFQHVHDMADAMDTSGADAEVKSEANNEPNQEPLPTTETDGPSTQQQSSITEEQWLGLKDMLQFLYDYREEE
jgi:hypothetical protein